MKISLCMIVKNEEKVLERALKSIAPFVDEIIIVDTGSTDSTKQIAKKFTNKIFDFVWIDDFASARNFSFSKATGDFIMWLDADDEVTKENLQKLLSFKKELSSKVDVYMLKYVFENQDGEISLLYYRERIIKNNMGMQWCDPVHEYIKVSGKIKYLDISIHHKKETACAIDRNLKIYEKLIAAKGSLTPRQTFYYARELYYNGKYQESINQLSLFLNNPNAWLENKIEASILLSKCYLSIYKYENALRSLFASFAFDYPRAEILLEIGNVLMLSKEYKKAIHWLKLATKCKAKEKTGAFITPTSYKLAPYLQLCVCYFKLNKIALAKKYNKLAQEIAPNNLSVQINNKFFENM